MSTSLKEEFKLFKFGVGHDSPILFITSQWNCSSSIYLLWRLFWLLWHVGWVVASPVVMVLYQSDSPEEGAKWLIYLTHTTLLLTAITSTLDFLTVFFLSYTRRGRATLSSWNHEKSVTGPPLKEDIIFHGEFTVLSGLEPGNVEAVDVIINSVNSFFIISNGLVTAMPVRILHFLYPVLYGAAYFIFTYIYYAAGGTNILNLDIIYSALDWNHAYPTVLGVVIGVLVCAPIAHLGLFALYTFRIFLFSKIHSGNFKLSSELDSHQHIAGSSRQPTTLEINLELGGVEHKGKATQETKSETGL
ncbi:protein rolling stone-like isoform X2 [Biomphalaria glabrata]|uniref:Protein rolling stone-like isoform X2 n=1 Tax=Biomphalaria glabrata TaxID=6526 RepID=A0A9U8DU15_BIOGL|nr:protein rolling stone-like isoform X2 [Biomphalaria glabrata]